MIDKYDLDLLSEIELGFSARDIKTSNNSESVLFDSGFEGWPSAYKSGCLTSGLESGCADGCQPARIEAKSDCVKRSDTWYAFLHKCWRNIV